MGGANVLDLPARATTTVVTLDAGPMIGLDRNDRRVIALLARAKERGDVVVIPGTALAQAVRDPARQARLARLLRQQRTAVVPLGRKDATAAGKLLATSGTTDIADAHVVVCARRAGTTVVTSDPDDIGALDPALEIVPV